MSQYWDSRLKIEKIKNSKRASPLIQAPLINQLWKSQMGGSSKSTQRAQRYHQKLHMHHGSKVEHLCVSQKMGLHTLVTPH